MTNQDYLNNAKLENAGEYIVKYMRTAKLIELFSCKNIFDLDDIVKAISDSDVFDFLPGDVKFIHACNSDHELQNLEKKLDLCYEIMAKMPIEDRENFYNNVIKDYVGKRDKRRNEINDECYKSGSKMIFY